MIKLLKYKVTLTLLRDQLGTNPIDPNVMDTHILDRQRKLILEKGGINTQINKYLDQIQISAEKGDAELELIIDKLESLIGYELTAEEREQAIAGKLESLKETFQEMDIKGTTVFFWDKKNERPCIGDHMIYGFLKGSCEAISRTLSKKNGTIMHSCSYTQSIINQHVSIQEQFIVFDQDLKKNHDGSPHYFQRSLRAMTAKGPRISLAKSEVVEAGAKLTFTLRVLDGSPLEEKHLHELFSYGEIKGLGQWRNAGYGSFSYEMEKIK
jgi:hypothetical protein